MKRKITAMFLSLPLLLFGFSFGPETGADDRETGSLDEKVSKFLESRKNEWLDMNVSTSDGKVLYDLILKNRYTRAIEIGTSTGHSAIWMAWALSKTGGKLITIEIDEGRYKTALMNFKKAGLSEVIDARLADAHDLVKELKGPLDFVFCDADKDWYKNYFIALVPKLEVGGCFTAHNVSWRYNRDIKAFLDYVSGLSNFKTTINRASSEGISISCKTAAE
ncbi:MAG: class I SAM-dependent methyltransferase [Proteobacteria bacterium]|nr:class I SAM-dependent methyltransferase [Pseudomonadota bacterium]